MDTGTTIWIDTETRDDLKALAEANSRSMAGQIRFMVKVELAKMESLQPGDGKVSSSDCAE
jgi:predicted DNA-binding protein